MLVRYILEACLDIALCIGLQLYYFGENIGNTKVFDFTNFFFTVNTIMTMVLGILIVIFLPVVGVFYIRRFRQWESEEFENKFGALFEGIRKDRKSALGYPFIFILRRLAFALVCLFSNDNVVIQLWCLMISSTIQIIYLILAKPFEEALMQQLEIFNEVCTIALIYIMLCFSDANIYRE